MSKSKKRKSSSSKGGRPAGSKTAERDQSIAELSRCPKCHSTDREAYAGRPYVTRLSGTREGKPFNRIIRRRTRCTTPGCRQARFDLTYELVDDSRSPTLSPDNSAMP